MLLTLTKRPRTDKDFRHKAFKDLIQQDFVRRDLHEIQLMLSDICTSAIISVELTDRGMEHYHIILNDMDKHYIKLFRREWETKHGFTDLKPIKRKHGVGLSETSDYTHVFDYITKDTIDMSKWLGMELPIYFSKSLCHGIITKRDYHIDSTPVITLDDYLDENSSDNITIGININLKPEKEQKQNITSKNAVDIMKKN